MDVTSANFQQEVLDSPVPVLVDFWGTWCGPCRMLKPVVEALAKEVEGQYKVVKLDADESPDLVAQYKVDKLPTLLIFKGGNEVHRMIGLQSREKLLTALHEAANV